MKLFRLIPVYAAAAALILVPAVSAAQAQQATETTKDTAKKAKKRAKKTTEEQAGEAAAPAKGEAQTPETPKAKKTGSAQRAMPTASDSEIAAAQASGKVWVNTETGVYHKGGRWYGATKQGKFMTEDDAIKAGYRASKSK
jgi:hypothetical protein